MQRDIFRAIADPTRRDIIRLLAQRPLHLNAVAENFSISRPAISKHIKILAECGLIAMAKHGRERYCELQPAGLREIAEWAEQYRRLWADKLNALDTFLLKQGEEKNQKSKKYKRR